jgi:hypothetical protein
MATQRRLKYASGSLAIYDVESTAIDDGPFSSPLSYISRLHFHSDLEYPAVIATYSGTVTLPSVSANTDYVATYNIAAHGRGGVPYVEGRLQVGGVWVPFAGSIPVVQPTGTAGESSFARFLHLGADSTNIVIQEYSTACNVSAYGSVGFNYVIYLTNKLVA